MFLLLLAAFGLAPEASAKTPTVRAVLFYSPTCGHCHKVITEDLPPLQAKYQEQLQILGIDVTQADGQKLYQQAVAYYRVPSERLGVPALIVGTSYLVGSQEIPEQFPALIDSGLSAGGVGWPDFPGLSQVLPTPQPGSEQDTGAGQAITSDQTIPGNTWRDKFAHDPFGNTLAVIVLLGMIASAAGVVVYFLKEMTGGPGKWPAWIVPVLALLGVFVAGYLTYVEITQARAICGPVGDCNAVQQSPYARLFGVLPVGILGAAGYLAILGAWLLYRNTGSSFRNYAALSAWGMAWFGVIFSIYLTFLEPFVIGSTCIWCLSSAILITLLLWATTPAAIQSWSLEEEDDLESEGAQV